jgi:hypothetical protein
VLTFGDLWGGTKGPREIDLQMVTTCLTLGRPYKLPELADDFYFEPAELRKLFPDEVVAKLEEGAAAKRVGDYLPLPEPAGLPVVFAARLSLSFPVLLSTVPLYRKTVNADGTPTFLRCHFSDGGICSNFPVNFFDSALPRWPSFGINLAGPIVDDVDVWMPKTNTDPEPGPAGPIENVNGFVSGIVRSAQNWHDNSFVEMPGFRDRIAQIRFAAGEGGLNLNMPRQLIDDMSKRGELAGTKLCSRFIDGTDVPGGPPIELTWNNHRRIRQRVAYAAIEEFAMELLVGYTGNEQLVGKPRRFPANTPMANEQTYAQLRDGATSEYASFDPQQRSLAATIALIAEVCGGLWAHVRGRDLEPCKTPAMSVDAPKPAMKAGIGPPL